MLGEKAGDALFGNFLGIGKVFFPERMGIGGTRYRVVKLYAEDRVAYSV